MARIRGQHKVIYELIRKNEEMSIIQLRQSLTGIGYNSLRSALISLTKRGWIERVGRGVYRIKKK